MNFSLSHFPNNLSLKPINAHFRFHSVGFVSQKVTFSRGPLPSGLTAYCSGAC